MGSNKAGITGAAADGSLGTAQNAADTDIRIFAGSTFGNRGSAPFRVTQEGGFRAEFGHVGGFTIGSDALISTTADQPQITLGQNLVANPTKQITLSARSADEFMLYAGIEVPAGGVGIKKTDNPPFGVDKDGKVLMRSFELRDESNSTILSSDNLLSGRLLSQINSALGAGSATVEFVQDSPNEVVDLEIDSQRTVTIEFEISISAPYVYGGLTQHYTASQMLNSIVPKFEIEIEHRTQGSSVWQEFGKETFTGVKNSGSVPSLNDNKYWINQEEYFDRSRGQSRRSQIESGYGCITSQGKLKGSYTRVLSAGDYEFRINSSTSGTKNVAVHTRTFTPNAPGTTNGNSNEPAANEVRVDHGYGSLDYFDNSSPSDAQIITNDRTFRISDSAGGSFAVDTNASPIRVTEGKTFDDFLGLSGGHVTGTLRANTIHVGTSATSLTNGGSAPQMRLTTTHGYLDLGPDSTNYSHFRTDRPGYYFDKGITVDTGKISSYNEILQLQVSGTTRCQLSSTNISAQNGAKFSGAGAIGYVDVTYTSNTDDDQVVPYSIPTGTKPIAAVVVDPNQGTTGTDGNGNGFDMATIRNLKQGSMIVNRYDIEHGTPSITMRIYYTTTDT